MNNKHELEKKIWEQPKLEMIGKINEIVQVGEGKESFDVGDPGEPRKVPSTEMEY